MIPGNAPELRLSFNAGLGRLGGVSLGEVEELPASSDDELVLAAETRSRLAE